MFNKFALLSSICLVLLVACFLGCGQDTLPGMVPVTGKITLDGEPLQKAEITFKPTEGGNTSNGFTDENGEYIVYYAARRSGAKIGEHSVTISKTLSDDSTRTPEEAALDPEGEFRDSGTEFAAGSEANSEHVPSRYNSKSELTATVEDKKNVINFDLTSDK